VKKETCFAVYQSERKRINKTKKHPSLSTLKGYEVASLFNLSSTVPIAPLLKNSGSSRETKILRGPAFSQRKARSGLLGRFTIQ
jgi:hypothetical protein